MSVWVIVVDTLPVACYDTLFGAGTNYKVSSFKVVPAIVIVLKCCTVKLCKTL